MPRSAWPQGPPTPRGFARGWPRRRFHHGPLRRGRLRGPGSTELGGLAAGPSRSLRSACWATCGTE
eukprot:7480115-Alexandrium_andersonii.AAC.1